MHTSGRVEYQPESVDPVRRFCAVVAVNDCRRAGRAPALGAALSDAGNLPLTILDVLSDGAVDRPVTAHGAERRTLLADDDVVAQVVERVSSRDGVLLVIDVHGGGPPGGRLFDDDAERLLERLHQPVLIVGPYASLPASPGVLVLPVDGAGPGDVVLPVVECWASTFGAADIVLAALDAPDPWPDDREESIGRETGRAAALLAERGIVPAVRRLVTTDAATSLIEMVAAFDDAVLVLAAPRWPGAASHWFATARQLIRYASCPAIIVPADLGASTARTPLD